MVFIPRSKLEQTPRPEERRFRGSIAVACLLHGRRKVGTAEAWNAKTGPEIERKGHFCRQNRANALKVNDILRSDPGIPGSGRGSGSRASRAVGVACRVCIIDCLPGITSSPESRIRMVVYQAISKQTSASSAVAPFHQIVSFGNWVMASRPRWMHHDHTPCTGPAAGNSRPRSLPQALHPKLGTARWGRPRRLFPR